MTLWLGDEEIWKVWIQMDANKYGYDIDMYMDIVCICIVFKVIVQVLSKRASLLVLLLF